MSYGVLFLRVVIGTIFFLHGTQTLLGWWGGPGLGGTRGWLGSIGFRRPGPLAFLVALAESSGIVFALGFLTPFVAGRCAARWWWRSAPSTGATASGTPSRASSSTSPCSPCRSRSPQPAPAASRSTG